MSGESREHLVVLDPGVAKKAVAKLQDIADVTQVLEPRLVILRADSEARIHIAQIEGVLGIFDDSLPELADLTPAERIFLSAWDARRRPKSRRGDELPWDSPGFSAPNGPTDSDEAWAWSRCRTSSV